MRRVLPVALAAVPLACTGEPAEQGPLDPIACAVGGKAELTDVCMVQRVREQGELLLVVRQPDGASRRFRVTRDGTGLVLANGETPDRRVLVGHTLDVTVGADRYIFPASRKDDSAPGDAPQ